MSEPRIGSLFSGYGGLDAAVKAVLGGTVAWHCENNPAAARLLAHHAPDVPNLGDITAAPWADVKPVDVLTGGFPCQDVSSAGRRAGLTPDSRSGLWTHMARAINVLRPRLVVIENVRGLLSADAACDVEPCPWCLGDDEGRPLRALGALLGDLAVLGYDAQWCGVRASDAGAPHPRFRVIVTAWPAGDAPSVGWDSTPAARPCRDREPAWAPRGSGGAASDTTGIGRREGWSEPARIVGGPDAAVRSSRAFADADGDGLEIVGERAEPHSRNDSDRCGSSGLDWGDYGPAVRRWELILGRPAPAPTMTGRRGGQQLAPAFVEWLMGLPAGHVTDVPGLSRNDQLKLLGNGVVPQQAELALRHLLAAETATTRSDVA